MIEEEQAEPDRVSPPSWRTGTLRHQRERKPDPRRPPSLAALGQSVIVDRAGKAVGLLCVGHDITEQHRMERELADYKQHLEAMVEARTAELSLARTRQKRRAVPGTFLTSMSHELRTPFHGILGGHHPSPGQDGRYQGAGSPGQGKNSRNRLLHVINDILDISKIEADRMELESVQFQLLPIFESLSSLLGNQARGKGVSLTTEIAPARPSFLARRSFAAGARFSSTWPAMR